MYKLSRTSLDRLQTCHEDLQMIILVALSVSQVDFGVAEGHRSVEVQQDYYEQGKSRIDGITRLSKHNLRPSMAVDIYGFVNGRSVWDKETMSYVAGVIMGVAAMLYRGGEVSHLVRWGGNWDMDGEILHDQSFDDRPHFELIKPKR